MKPLTAIFVSLLLGPLCSFHAQTPTGSVSGTVWDVNHARLPGASVIVKNVDNGVSRSLTTDDEGEFNALALFPGSYKITAESDGFRLQELTTTVTTGTITTLNLILELAGLKESIVVADPAPLLQYDQNQIGDVITRKQIENLPLNGRNFLDLAKLEPGVTNPIRGTNNRVFVPILGSGVQNTPRIGYTRVTADGADINFIGSIGAALQISQEVVQEFQISSAIFDLSTSLTSNGSINVVTRSGGNKYHGSGFYLYRDHNLAAYPGLQRDPRNPDPFFQRQQSGYQFGGPIRKDRVFFFTSLERDDQRGVLSIQPRTPEFAPLGGVFPSPFLDNQFSIRFDVRLNRDNNFFVRYTHDGNRLFGPFDGRNTSLPSGWSRISNWVDQSIVGLTSVLTPNLVNDLRWSYFFVSSPEIPATYQDCPACLGLGAPRINIMDAGVTIGAARRLAFVGRRYEFTDNLSWHRNHHLMGFGFDWEHSTNSSRNQTDDPATLNLFSPREVRQFNATASAESQIPLPSSFLTLHDLLQLPLKSFQTAVGPNLVLQRDFRDYRQADLFRVYGNDSRRLGERVVLNYGLAWSYEPNGLNTFLSKPNLLTDILGSDLNPPSKQLTNVAFNLGLVWRLTDDNKTVLRAGAGQYFDPISFNSGALATERRELFPVGTGPRTVPGTAIQPPLDFTKIGPTRFSGADLLAILPAIRAYQAQQLNPDNRDFTFRNIDLDKTGTNLSDPFSQTPYALHLNLGVQRELVRNLSFSADFVWRRFLHNYVSDIDYNHFYSSAGPAIPPCPPTVKSNLTTVCSNGPITFDNTTGIAQDTALLLRLEKRFSHKTQFLVSYALASFKGSNGAAGPGVAATGFNNYNWFENYGPLPTDLRHILNVSGFIELPRDIQVSLNLSAYSRPPFLAYVSGMDFNGDGTTNDLLPGTTVNQFNRGLGQEDLIRLVDLYNRDYAGKRTPGGPIALPLVVPSNISFNDSFFTGDIRVSRTFSLSGERVHLVLFGDVFNLFNTANLVQYSGNIADPTIFAQPGARFSQVFGSGGPRALQFGLRINF